MATVMEYQNVTRLHRVDELPKRRSDVSSRRLHRRWVSVQHHEDVGFIEPKTFYQRSAHAPHIIRTSVQLTLGARVIAPYKQRPLRHLCLSVCLSVCICVSLSDP